MIDPVSNNQYLSQFIQEYRDRILEKFQHQASQTATQKAIEQAHDHNKAVIATTSSIETDFDNQSRIVQDKAKAAGLNQPLQPALTGPVNSALEQAKSKIKQGKAQFDDVRSKEFAKHQSNQEEVTGKTLD